MHLFGLHIKSLINQKIESATFGIVGGGIAPITLPGYAPALVLSAHFCCCRQMN